ncbi:3,4-dihydroxy-2-butanone-4-phosphate synthase [Jatrophihabitans sp. YIM 134969]
MSDLARDGLRVLFDDPVGMGVLAAPATTAAAAIAAIVRHGSGFLFVTVTEETAARLDLPAMPGTVADGSAASRQRVSVDAAAHVGTGISARDRARTATLLADPTTVAPDLTRPGHVVPVVVHPRDPTVTADRVHVALRGPAVHAAVPGGIAGVGLATAEECRALARALGVPAEHLGGTQEEPDEFLGQLCASLLVGR